MTKNQVIKWLTELDASALALAGGKGANLGELVQTGFSVSPGFVVTTPAYDAFVEVNGLQPQIIELAAQTQMGEPATFEVAAQKIRARFAQGALPAELAQTVTRAYRDLIKEGGQAVAVRSSATAEDLPSASFAGQQESYLNIQGEQALLDAVKACWASLWTARAMVYRQRQGIAPSAVRLAVVVQKLVDADASGILFTANPTNGEREQILINATWGLGEAIVGGLVTPDTVVVDKTDWQILARDTATKSTMTVRTETGTKEQPVPADQQDTPVLDDATAVELAKYGAQIEAHYGMPMDIEWAITHGEIAILQARPITSMPAAPLKNVVWEPPVPDTMWMRRQIVEHMPEPLSPLFEDLYLGKGMDETFDGLVRALGEVGGVEIAVHEVMPHGFADTINGYAYTSGSYRMSAGLVWSVLKIYARIFRFFKHPEFDYEGTVLPRYQRLIAEWDALDLEAATDGELLRGISEMSAADSQYWFGSAPKLAFSRILDPVFDRLLRSFLLRRAVPEEQRRSAAFLRGFDSKALDAQADMERLANAIRASNSLRKIVLDTQANGLLAALADYPDGQRVLDEIQAYLDQYGHQIYNLDYVDPTQTEDPLPLLLSLKALVKNAPAENARARQATMAAERDALVERTARSLNPLSRRLFRWVWKWTKEFGPYREQVMFYMGAAWPTVRKLAHELGQRLTNAGAIAAPADIYYLQSDEIRAATASLADGQSAIDLRQLVQERRALRERRKLLTPPPKVPQRSSIKFGPVEFSMFDPTPSDATDSEGPVLKGYAVSTGKVTAPASVIRSIQDFDKMQPNTILVCTTTTPAWTPLFSQAVGLVTDVGGALAHGSIVAREYGIPAVMGTGVATERIQSGMMLAVDGDAGTVTLVNEAGATVDTPAVEPQATTNGRKKR